MSPGRFLKGDRRPLMRVLLTGPLPPETAFAFQGHFRLLDKNASTATHGNSEDLCLLDCGTASAADLTKLTQARAIAIVGPFAPDVRVVEPGSPCFLIVGEKAHKQIELAGAIRDQLTDARLIRFPDLGPRAHIEEPELIARVLRRELDEVPVKSRGWFPWRRALLPLF